MRRVTIVLLTFLLIFSPSVLAASTQYVRRQDDTLVQEELEENERLTQEAVEKRQEQELNAQAQGLDSINEEPAVRAQDLNVYGWFEAIDSSVISSENAELEGGESRMTLGTPGSGSYLETLKIYTRDKGLNIKYKSRLQGQEWQEEVTGTYDLAESSGNKEHETVKMNNLSIRLDGPTSLDYDLYYRVYVSGEGWYPWAGQGNPAVSEEQGVKDVLIESLEMRILPKGSPVPPDSVDIYNVPVLKAEAYVENTEWMEPALGKNITIGTEGQSLRLEALKISTDNPDVGIQYQILASGLGWLDPSGNGAESGTEGEFRPIEAIRMNLTGSQAANYDLYYRVHIQYYGWLDWANNNQIAGTTNQDLRLEAIQIKILPKGAIVPGPSETPSIIAMDPTEGEVIKYVNFLRKDKGLSFVTGDEKLHEAALRRSGELTHYYSHIRPNSKGYETVLEEIPYRSDGLIPALGENILGIPDAQTAFLSFSQKNACLKVMSTDYYRYMAFVTNVTNDPEEGDGYSVMLLTDTPSLVEVQDETPTEPADETVLSEE